MDKHFRVDVAQATDGDDCIDFPDVVGSECRDCGDDPMVAYNYAHWEAERGFKATVYYGNDFVMTLE